jgi:hypothetical protein
MFVLMFVRMGCSEVRKKARIFVAALKGCREELPREVKDARSTHDDPQSLGDLTKVSRCFDATTSLDGL